MLARRCLSVIYTGPISFQEALQRQLTLVDKVISAAKTFENIDLKSKEGVPPIFEEYLLLCEHDPPVYTVGRRCKNYAEQMQKLENTGAQFHKIDRGGLVTFHGPGQLVAYPILHISASHITNNIHSVRRYVELLENTVIHMFTLLWHPGS
eukprot:Sdes_comp18387_c0_seq1m8209